MSIQSFIDNNDNSNSHQSNSSNKLHEFDLHHQNKHKTTTSIISSMKSSQIDVINLNDGLTIRVNNHFYQNMSKISNINKIRQTIYQNFLIDIEKAETQVFQQISKEKLDKIQQLFKRYPLPFNIKKKKSYSNNNLLHQSVKIGSRNIIDYFMMRNEKLINQGNIYGKTPIHFCLIYHPNLLSHFIKNWDKYVDWNYKDKIGSTYLHYCYFYNLDQSIKQLIEKKNIESTNILGMNSFQCVPEAQTHCKFKYHKEGEDQISNRKIQYFKKDNRNQQKKAFKFSKLIYSKQNSEISQQNLQNTFNEIKIDDFDIVSKLGQGAYSKVFKVKYKPSQNYYALKAFEKYKLDWKKLKYFLNQRNVLMNSSHPYLIKFYCSFQNSKFLFLITELCEGGTLKDIIYNNNQFITQQKAKIYVTQIVSVVSYLHDKSIIHRDIKPQNIGLDRDGHIKLFDLGLSKSLKKNMTRTFCGTEDYLPPEVINNQQYTYTIDWYILGVMIYEMLTKTMPKKQKLEIQKFTDSLKDLIKKLLQPDKDLRIGSKRDGQEIKQHSWFNDINWNTVSKKKVINARIVKKQDPQLSKTTKLTDWFQNVQNQVINQNFDEIDSWNSTVRML